MVNITSLNTTSGIVLSIKSVLPTIFNNRTISAISNFVETVATVFKINIDQLNEFFNNTFIATSSGIVLNNLIHDLSGMSPYDGESDNDFRNRYYDWCYHYKATRESISGIVFDVIGEEADQIYSLSDRNAFWQEKNNPTRTYQNKYFYDDVGKNRVFWNTDSQEKDFIGYIYLREKPSDTILSKLIDTIEQVKGQGTKIYILYPPSNDTIFEHKIENMYPSFLQNTSRLLNINNMSLINLPTQFNNARFYHTLSSSGSVTIQDQTAFNNDFIISNLPSSIDWKYSNIGKGFYLNFANDNLTNIATAETATSSSNTYNTPFYAYNGKAISGSGDTVSITNNLMGYHEAYTKLTLKCQFINQVSLGANEIRFLFSRSIVGWGAEDGTEFHAYLITDGASNQYINVIFRNSQDYNGKYINFYKQINFVVDTLYSFIFSVDFTNKYITMVFNDIDYSSSYNIDTNTSFSAFNQVKANLYYPIYKTDTGIGMNTFTSTQTWKGLIYRPYVNFNEYITPSQALAENAKFGF